jgi:hypothetical protein
MDVLAGSGLEPQLAIPVIVCVLGALLVYVFGFQKTEEPSYAHLAILQSSSSYKNRSVGGSKVNKGPGAKHKVTSNSNGQVSNGSVVKSSSKPAAVASVAEAGPSNKVNKANAATTAPQQVKAQQQAGTKKEKVKGEVKNKPEDFESGKNFDKLYLDEF